MVQLKKGLRFACQYPALTVLAGAALYYVVQISWPSTSRGFSTPEVCPSHTSLFFQPHTCPSFPYNPCNATHFLMQGQVTPFTKIISIPEVHDTEHGKSETHNVLSAFSKMCVDLLWQQGMKQIILLESHPRGAIIPCSDANITEIFGRTCMGWDSLNYHMNQFMGDQKFVENVSKLFASLLRAQGFFGFTNVFNEFIKNYKTNMKNIRENVFIIGDVFLLKTLGDINRPDIKLIFMRLYKKLIHGLLKKNNEGYSYDKIISEDVIQEILKTTFPKPSMLQRNKNLKKIVSQLSKKLRPNERLIVIGGANHLFNHEENPDIEEFVFGEYKKKTVILLDKKILNTAKPKVALFAVYLSIFMFLSRIFLILNNYEL